MSTLPLHIARGTSAVLFVLSAGIFAYTDEVYYLWIPVALLLCTVLLQYPLYLLYLLLLTIPWSVEYQFSQTLGTDLPDEPLMLLLAFSAVMMMVWRGVWRQKIPFIVLILVLQFAWALIAVLTSTDLLLSLKYLLAKGWYLLAFVAAPLLLWRNQNDIKMSALMLLGSTLVCMCVVLWRHAQNGWSFERINDSVYPFFRNHVNYSALLVCMMPLELAVIGLARSGKTRLVCRWLFLLTIAALYFSYARGAWLALFTGLLAYWLLRRRLLFSGFLLVLSLCLLSFFWLKKNDRYLKFTGDYRTTIFHTDFRQHLIATYQLRDLSNAERFYRWVAAVRMVPDSWKTGFGPSSFYNQYKAYTLPVFKTWVSRNEERSTVHNYFLLILVEQGVMGLFLLLVLTGTLFWQLQHMYHRTNDRFRNVCLSATASLLVMACTVNFLSDLVETDKIGSVFYLCVAMVTWMKRTHKDTDPSGERPD